MRHPSKDRYYVLEQKKFSQYYTHKIEVKQFFTSYGDFFVICTVHVLFIEHLKYFIRYVFIYFLKYFDNKIRPLDNSNVRILKVTNINWLK